jgi:hypothetical protein
MDIFERVEVELEKNGYEFRKLFDEDGKRLGFVFAEGYWLFRLTDTLWELQNRGKRENNFFTGGTEQIIVRDILSLGCIPRSFETPSAPDLPVSDPKKASLDNPKDPAVECSVCLEEIQTRVALNPCGHTRFCKVCGDALKTCPLCRAKVVQVLTIFL